MSSRAVSPSNRMTFPVSLSMAATLVSADETRNVRINAP